MGSVTGQWGGEKVRVVLLRIEKFLLWEELRGTMRPCEESTPRSVFF